MLEKPTFMPDWRPYLEQKNGHHHTVTGDLQVSRGFWSPQLQNHRDILVYLPPSYHHSSQRYPVLYMHDGQNLFDAATSYAGEWQVDETMETLATRGYEAIVVGIPNMGVRRMDEYSPFRDPRHGGGDGKKYVNFIADTLKPAIDRDFRTHAAAAATGVLGSSMGGLISLYAFFHRPQVFGYAGIMSPSVWFADEALLRYVEDVPYQPGKIYLDAGTREYAGFRADRFLHAASRQYYGRVRRLKRILVQKGYRPVRQLLHVEEKEARHEEAAWARRLERAICFFLEE